MNQSVNRFQYFLLFLLAQFVSLVLECRICHRERSVERSIASTLALPLPISSLVSIGNPSYSIASLQISPSHPFPFLFPVTLATVQSIPVPVFEFNMLFPVFGKLFNRCFFPFNTSFYLSFPVGICPTSPVNPKIISLRAQYV